MNIRKILVSQPKPQQGKSPYFDVAAKHGVEVVFRPLIKVEGLTARDFRKQRINLPDYTAIIFTARTAVDHYFRLCKEVRFNVPDTMKYFCVTEAIARYLQKYIVYRKRKIFYAENSTMEELIPLFRKHNKEKYLMPISDVHTDDKTSVIDELPDFTYVKAVMYRTVSNDFTVDEPFDYDMVILFTPTGVKSLTSNVPDYLERNLVIGAMGDKTAEEVREVGLVPQVMLSPEATSMPAAIDIFLTNLERENGERKDDAAEQ